MRIIITTLLFLFFSFNLLNGQTPKSVPNPKTKDAHNYVSNPNNILSGNTVDALNEMLNELDRETGTEIAVVALKSIGNNEIKTFATELFEIWGVGKADADNGLLILFVEDQRKITFETGYGMEGALPDAVCKRIQMNTMIPYFKDGDYDGGILAGTRDVISVIHKESVSYYDTPSGTTDNPSYGIYDTTDDPSNDISEYPKTNILSSIGGVLLYCIWLYVLILAVLVVGTAYIIYRAKNNSELSNPAKCVIIKRNKGTLLMTITFLLPFISLFIIIFFFEPKYALSLIVIPFLAIPPNIYAKWRMRQIKNTPVFCNSCESEMRLLYRKEEKKYLKSPQIMEEDLSSVMYDIYFCNACKDSIVYKLNLDGKYAACSKCENRTYGVERSVTIRAATESSTGLKQVTYTCKYCHHKNMVDEIIPRKLSSSGSSFGGGSSGGSGGSFGGGRSGGGGSTSSW